MKKKYLLFYQHVILIFALTLLGSSIASGQSCNCDHTITLKQEIVDGSKMNISPGDVICIEAGRRQSLWLENFKGTAEKPLIIKNCGGQVVISNNNRWGISISNSKYFKLEGTGDSRFKYGIKVDGVATVGLSFNRLTTDFEAHHIEVHKSLGPGCMAKSDPECGKPETWRGKFVMRNVKIHDFYIHDVGTKAGGGEGFYIGHSFFNGINTSCGKLYPHNIENIKIYDNIVENTAFDGMQVSCAVSGVEVYNNRIKNFGMINNGGQQSGLVIGGGSKGKFFDNQINKGTGMGICVFGQGDIYLYNNVVSNTGREGIFIDDRGTDKNLGFYCYNNTVVNTKSTGILSYNALLKTTQVFNNLVVCPGNWQKQYDYRKAFIYLENMPNKKVKFDSAGNYICKSISDVKFVDPDNYNFHLKAGSPAIDKGKDLLGRGISLDIENRKRPSAKTFDAGAYEFDGILSTPQKPTPSPLKVSVTTTKSTCNAANGKASVSVTGGTSPYQYKWFNGKTTSSINGLKPGKYSVSITDSKGLKAAATATVTSTSSINLTYSKKNVVGTAKGSINLTVSGGETPYTYKWSNGSTSQDISGLKEGSYTASVKDKVGCTKSITITISKETAPTPAPSSGFSGSFNIISKQTGRYLEVKDGSTAANAKIVITDKSASSSQIWKLEPTGDGYYKIISVKSGKALDLEGSKKIDGTNIIQNNLTSSDCQKWKLTDVGGGYYSIKAKCSGRGLEVKANSKVNGAPVGQWTYWGGNYQKWKLQKIGSTSNRLETTEEPSVAEETSSTIKIFPNPVHGDFFNVSFESTEETEIVISIINPMSEKVLELKFPLSIGENQFEIPSSSLKTGIHLMVFNAGKLRIVKRIAITK